MGDVGNTRKGGPIMTNPKASYANIIAFVGVMIAMVFSIIYTNTVDTHTERKFCALLNQFAHVYEDTPPTTDLGRQVAAQYETLRQQLGCLNVKP